MVDAADYEWAMERRWYLGTDGYAYHGFKDGEGRTRQVALHRELLGLRRGDRVEVDHINRVRLDNRRANLRKLTRAENAQNFSSRGGSSKYRGVSWNKARQRWEAYAMLDRKQHRVGQFKTEEEAADAAARFREMHMPFSAEGTAAA